MSFRDQTIESFFSSLSSKAPIPGGGGASALCGALSTSLAHMVAALTVGKPKYAAVEAQMNELLTRADALQERFLALMDEDATAFEPLALAYRLPKETEEEKTEKARRMEIALRSAVQPPMEIMERCKDALELISICAKSGTVVAVSDAGVAASLCRAALEGAAMNVFINTQSMQDRAYAEALNKRAKEMLAEYCPAADAITKEVFSRLCDRPRGSSNAQASFNTQSKSREMGIMRMNICILNGSPRPHGNTAELLKPFYEELVSGGAQVKQIQLSALKIASCKGCYQCQDVKHEYGCVQQDDMQGVAKAIIESDSIVLATPIYTWYCTPELKAVLDRFYGLAKYYRSAKGNLVEGKHMALLTTHGYDASYAADPFVIGIQRMCEHYHMRYEGMYSVRDVDDLASFQTKQAQSGAREFAQYLLRKKA